MASLPQETPAEDVRTAMMILENGHSPCSTLCCHAITIADYDAAMARLTAAVVKLERNATLERRYQP